MIFSVARLNNLELADGRSILPRDGQYDRHHLGDVIGIAIHHTVPPLATSPLTIARYHVEKHGWPAIGYHFLVYDQGDLIWCLDLEEYGAHVRQRNHELWGIALVGDFTDHRPPQAQLRATYRLIAELQTIFGDFLPVHGHQGWALSLFPTACPGASHPTWLPYLQRTDTSLAAAMMASHPTASIPSPFTGEG